MEQPSEWFWNMLEEARPSLHDLESKLMEASQEDVRQFSTEYRLAAEMLCDYWDGPVVNGVEYSEDDTEDVCNWIVSQGRDLWRRTLTGEIAFADLAEIVSLREFARLPVPTAEWTTEVANPAHRGYQDPSDIAAGVYYSRFGSELSSE